MTDAPQDQPIPLGPEILSQFPPELHSVLNRHGPDLVGYCCTMIGLNGGLDYLTKRLQARTDLLQALQHIAMGCEALALNLVRSEGWDSKKMLECFQDVARAKALVAVTPASSGKIILPN